MNVQTQGCSQGGLRPQRTPGSVRAVGSNVWGMAILTPRGGQGCSRHPHKAPASPDDRVIAQQ